MSVLQILPTNKPKFGEPCNRCGLCCMLQLCEAAILMALFLLRSRTSDQAGISLAPRYQVSVASPSAPCCDAHVRAIVNVDKGYLSSLNPAGQSSNPAHLALLQHVTRTRIDARISFCHSPASRSTPRAILNMGIIYMTPPSYFHHPASPTPCGATLH